MQTQKGFVCMKGAVCMRGCACMYGAVSACKMGQFKTGPANGKSDAKQPYIRSHTHN